MYLYQFVSENGVELLNMKEALKKYKVIGKNVNKYNRKELQEQPIFQNFLGPMWGGENGNGQKIIRYETQQVYDHLSM